MDLIYVKTDGDGVQTSGYLSNYEAAFDVSTDLDYITNDFELKMVLPTDASELLWAENSISTIIYVEGTEYGGEISGSIINIADRNFDFSSILTFFIIYTFPALINSLYYLKSQPVQQVHKHN